MKISLKTSFLFICILITSCKQEDTYTWVELVDSDLSQWDTYISYKLTDAYDGTPPKDESGKLIEPVGLNTDPNDVFTIVTENKEPVLRISGEYYGCIFTKSEYENYHFKLDVKWGTKKWIPRKNKLKDSGILYHSIGPMGVEYWRSWMLSQEFQIMEGHMGDFWRQADSAIDIKAIKQEGVMDPIADPNWDFLPMGAGEELWGFCLRSANHEKPHGEWNTLELISFEGKSLHIINGEVVMVLKNSRYVKDGKSYPMTKGKIQLQSEAAEVFYKNIQIKEIDKLPTKYNTYYE